MRDSSQKYKDNFTKNTSERLDDIASPEDFRISYCLDSRDSVFVKNKMEEADNDDSLKKDWFDKFFDLFEEFLCEKSKTSPFAKKIRVILKFFKVKDTLKRLNKINRSVDELVNLKVPAGEQDKRYQILASRLITANHLHSQIQKELS